MDNKEIVNLIKKEMEIIMARSIAGFSIYDQSFKIEELLKKIKEVEEA